MKKRTWVIATLLLFAAFGVHAELRVALVIGNAAYTDAPLANPVNDAHLIAASLKEARFQVTEYANLDLDHLRKAIQAFGDELTVAGKKRTALVYYSGHGVQAAGHNYLIPIGASIHKEADLELQALDVSSLIRQMESTAAGVNIVVLDACRDNPFKRTRTLRKGLARMDAGEGEFYLAYATAPDTEAQDGGGANSPYAKALAAAMVLPGLPIEEAFKRVRAQVLNETGNLQRPWESSSLLTSFYFNPSASTAQQPSPPAIQQSEQTSAHSSAPAAQPLVSINSHIPVGPTDSGSLHDCEDCPEMIAIRPGRFQMGSPDTEKDRQSAEGPVHEVYIRYAFSVSKFPITCGEWMQFVKEHRNGSYFCRNGQQDTRPVVYVSWQDAQDYAAWLSRKSGRHYRLLTEAEYEYVNRAGSQSAYFWGDSADKLPQYANTGSGTTPAGSFKPNAFGLYDTIGNGYSWTQDCYHNTYIGAPTDGSAWDPKSSCPFQRVARGGSFGYGANSSWVRSAFRGHFDDKGAPIVGFRLARDN
jgi:formylglycine-generating enzyme required for sulfatase activity